MPLIYFLDIPKLAYDLSYSKTTDIIKITFIHQQSILRFGNRKKLQDSFYQEYGTPVFLGQGTCKKLHGNT